MGAEGLLHPQAIMKGRMRPSAGKGLLRPQLASRRGSCTLHAINTQGPRGPSRLVARRGGWRGVMGCEEGASGHRVHQIEGCFWGVPVHLGFMEGCRGGMHQGGRGWLM